MATEQPQYEVSENEQNNVKETKTQQTKAAKEQTGPAAAGNKRKRSRKNTIETKPAGVDNDSEDIKLHVDADWSDDEKDDKEPTAKRVAAEGDESAPVAVKKASGGPLENFTVRAVVTRKDVDVIFEHKSGAKEELEAETSTSITIVAGKDDPDIVVDRVLIIKGPIEGVTAAYKVITQGMLAIKQSTAASAKSSSESKQKRSDKEDATHGEGETQAEDEDSEMEDNTAAATAAADDDNNEHDDENSEAEGDDDGNDSNGDGEEENSSHGDHESPSGATETADDAADAAADASKTAKADTSDEAKTTSPAKDSAKAKKDADSRDKKDTPNDRVTLRVLVPHKCVGSIMGHGGKTINHIRDTASVSIHTSENTLPRSTERIVAVIGAPASIQKAIGLIAQALTKDMASYNSPECYVPAANLPSAMTVETHFRKRKDNNKRFGHGHNDHHGSNRGHSNKGGQFRHHHNNNNNNNSNNGGNQGTGYSYNRHQNYHSGNQKSHGSGPGYNRGNAGNNNGGRNDRYNRNNNDRQGGRPRVPNAMSHVNRLPVGSNSNSNSGPQNQYNSGYRGSNHRGDNRASAAPNVAYGGYVIPPATSYPAYGSQGAGAASMGNGGLSGGRYGGGMAPVSPASAATNAYGGGYASAPAAYQFASPVGYAYSAAPVQNMYGGRPAQSPNQYPSRGNRQHVQQQQHQPQQHPQQYQGQYQQQNQHYQPSMAMTATASVGAATGGVGGSAGQTIQKIYVSADKVGAVIGRRGETINDIRQTTNARVDIQDSAHGNKERLIIITGGYEQVHSAYYMIQNKLATARPSGMRP